jgi:hypothetical protein
VVLESLWRDDLGLLRVDKAYMMSVYVVKTSGN